MFTHLLPSHHFVSLFCFHLVHCCILFFDFFPCSLFFFFFSFWACICTAMLPLVNGLTIVLGCHLVYLIPPFMLGYLLYFLFPSNFYFCPLVSWFLCLHAAFAFHYHLPCLYFIQHSLLPCYPYEHHPQCNVAVILCLMCLHCVIDGTYTVIKLCLTIRA